MAAIQEKIIQNLKTIGNISHNDKLTTQVDTFVIHEPGVIRGLYRYVYSENRTVNLDRIRDVIHHAKNECLIIQAAEHPSLRDSHMLDEMVSALESSLKGLSNMIETYKGDIATQARIELIISDTQTFLSHARDKMQLPSPSSDISEKRYVSSPKSSTE